MLLFLFTKEEQITSYKRTLGNKKNKIKATTRGPRGIDVDQVNIVLISLVEKHTGSFLCNLNLTTVLN